MAPMQKNPTVEMIKNVVSFCALVWSITLIVACQVSRQTGLAEKVHPALAIVLLWVATIWLSYVEGGQASLVGLAPVNRSLYKESHPIAYKCSLLAHIGDALDRYLLGRQFMVVFIVFTINISGGPIGGATVWGLPDVVIQIFMGSGLAMILFTTMVGQLNSQVNASHCMLDYLNSAANYFTLVCCILIEFSGLVHASYIIQMMVAAAAGKEIESNEAPRTPLGNLFFFTRCLMSLAILCFAFAVTLVALFNDQTTMWDSVPPGLAVVIFFLLMGVVGMLEGMQIAFFAVAKLRPEDRGNAYWAKMTCNVLFFGDGFNLSGFMIGRQLCVVSCMFFIARCTSLNIDPDSDDTIFGVSAPVQKFFNMGFLGALITTIVASIAWQLVASAFPLAFLSNPLTYFLLRLCLFLEGTGICNGAYVIAMVHKKIAGFQRDEVYIGTAEERAANATTADDYENLHVGAGHLVKLPGFVETLDAAPPALRDLAKKDPKVFSYLAEVGRNSSAPNSEVEKTDEGLDDSEHIKPEFSGCVLMND